MSVLAIVGIVAACSVVSAIGGAVLASYVISKDGDVVTIKEDECLIKKPKDGYVLVLVTPELARKLVTKGEVDGQPFEARTIYSTRSEKNKVGKVNVNQNNSIQQL
jgi:hypothetical protein